MNESTEQKKILIVEDDLPLRSVLTEKFTIEGFQVLEAVDGEEGLTIANKEHPNLIVLDIFMPRMDGISMMSRLREANSWGKHVPIVVLTNSTDATTIYKVTGLGASDFLIKSEWSLDDLVEKIRARLNDSEQPKLDLNEAAPKESGIVL